MSHPECLTSEIRTRYVGERYSGQQSQPDSREERENTLTGEAVLRTCTEHSGMTFKLTLTLSIQPLDKH